MKKVIFIMVILLLVSWSIQITPLPQQKKNKQQKEQEIYGRHHWTGQGKPDP